ncbi:Transglycosylase SLT domain-containing protein [Izhakiella capsodis]|uniref:Transglycosylase SLT domain-containing protein n=1 Tax=Izhakiella capsodis TaxID=1367852 RepID=A0A1I5BCL8_9GAMM|nr:lytic transglycosylase domain-containing protein [Izhakiella capsodis]SFN72478.1 Transglycosylase SLT domain-containing protein [Izhakiella capsodis]
MSVKSIWEINVDDSQFQDFLAKYNDYQKSLEQMPEQWRSIAQGIGITANEAGRAQKGAESVSAAFNAGIAALTTLNASVGELNGSLTQASKRQGDFGKKSRDSATFLRKANQHAKSLAGHIKSATGSLLSWGKILGIFSGVLGAGGLFGINKLASVASSQRFNAQGLNTTSGGLDASNINFNRILGNATATLGAIRNAQLDLGQRWKFQALGIKNPDADPSKILPELLRNARDIFNQTGRTQQGAEAYGLTSFMSMEDLTRLSKYSDAQIDAMAKQATADAQRLQLTDNQLRQWQDFNVQLDRSRLNIRSTFVRGLLPLAPQLTRLSSAFSDAVSAVMKSPAIGAGIDWLGNAIKRFSSYLSSPEFPRDVRDFMRGVARLARAIEKAADWIAWMFETPSEPAGPDKRIGPYTRQHFADENKSKSPSNVPWRGINPIVDPYTGKKYLPQKINDDFAAAAKKYGVSEKLLKAVAGAESSWDVQAKSKAGALGLMQVMPSNFKDGENPFNARDNIMAGARVLAWAQKRAHGNLDEMLRTYNGGVNRGSAENINYPQRVREQYLAMFGKPVSGSEQAGTTKAREDRYTSDLISAYTGSRPGIVIYNNTGGSALVSSTQLRGAH